MGDAFHRAAGQRMDAYLRMTMDVHRRALRFRCVGAASVLWTWLATGGQIQGMVLAHNNPYDVVAGPRDRARGRRRGHRLRGRAADARLAGRDGRRAGRARRPRRRSRGDLAAAARVATSAAATSARSAPRSTQSASSSSRQILRVDDTKPFIGLAPCAPERAHARLADQRLDLLGLHAARAGRRAHHADGHVAAEHPAEPAEHLASRPRRAGRRSRRGSAAQGVGERPPGGW